MQGSLKLGDFGYSKALHPSIERNRKALGTMDYQAPEIVNRQSQSGAVDVWALGVMTVELLCGKPPFEPEKELGLNYKESLIETFRRIQHEEPDLAIVDKAKTVMAAAGTMPACTGEQQIRVRV